MIVTNAVGAVFTAALLSASDAGVTFVFSEDGATNVLAWSALSPASREAVCRATDFEPLPPELAATFEQARRELRKLAALQSDGRLDSATAEKRRQSLRHLLLHKCRSQELPDDIAERLLKKLF